MIPNFKLDLHVQMSHVAVSVETDTTATIAYAHPGLTKIMVTWLLALIVPSYSYRRTYVEEGGGSQSRSENLWVPPPPPI